MDTTTSTGAGALLVMALSALISSGLLGAVFVYFRRLVETRIGAQHTATAIAVVGEAVRAAEQIGKTHGLDAGAKYAQALARSSDFLAAHGIALDSKEMQTLIEGAVAQLRIAQDAQAVPGVVVTGDSPQVTTAPPPPPGPTAEQAISAITSAVAALFPQSAAPLSPVVSADPVAVAAPQ
jgi:hypothetical protein